MDSNNTAQQLHSSLQELMPLPDLTTADLIKQLHELKQRLNDTEEIARLGSWGFDVKTRESSWSPTAFRLLGFDPAQREPDLETIYSRVHPEDREKLFAAVQQAIAAGDSFDLQIRIIPDNAVTRSLHVRGEAIRADDGTISRFMGVIQDITERVQYLNDFVVAQETLKANAEARKRQREFLRSIIDASSNVIFVLDENAVFTLANRKLAENSKMQVADIVGKNFRDIVHVPRAFEEVQQYIRRALAAPEQTFLFDEQVILDNRVFWSQTMQRAIPSLDGERYEVLFISTDITERKQAVEEAERARDAANAANRAKSEFLANMSHEIRTPMNGVLGMTQLLGFTSLNAEQQDYVATLQQSAEALLVVIDDILDISKLEAGKVTLHPADYDLNTVIEEIVALMQPNAMRKGLIFRTSLCEDLTTPLHGDPGRLRQVLLNLVGNAIKFTDKGSVWVQCEFLRQEQRVRISVKDSGPGISPSDQERLFQSFSQVDSSHTRRHGGTGLGLAISKQLVELMGGNIAVTSEQGKGSTFFLEIPTYWHDGSTI